MGESELVVPDLFRYLLLSANLMSRAMRWLIWRSIQSRCGVSADLRVYVEASSNLAAQCGRFDTISIESEQLIVRLQPRD